MCNCDFDNLSVIEHDTCSWRWHDGYMNALSSYHNDVFRYLMHSASSTCQSPQIESGLYLIWCAGNMRGQNIIIITPVIVRTGSQSPPPPVHPPPAVTFIASLVHATCFRAHSPFSHQAEMITVILRVGTETIKKHPVSLLSSIQEPLLYLEINKSTSFKLHCWLTYINKTVLKISLMWDNI